MTATYEVKVNGEVRMTFAGDFAQASSPITLEGDSTPFQVADARHRPLRAAELLIAWCDGQGGSNVGEDEGYTVETTDAE
jgi:hypothetical protein